MEMELTVAAVRESTIRGLFREADVYTVRESDDPDSSTLVVVMEDGTQYALDLTIEVTKL